MYHKKCLVSLTKLLLFSSVAGIHQCYSAGWSGLLVPVEAENFPLHHRVHTGSSAPLACYPMVTRCSFPGGKVAGAWCWILTSI